MTGIIDAIDPHRRTALDLVFRPLVVATLIGLVALSLGGLCGLFVPGWPGDVVAALGALAALAAQYTYWLFQTPAVRLSGALKYRIAELLALWLLLQIGVNVATGAANPFAGIPRFDFVTLLAFGLVFAAWLASTTTAGDLARLGEPPERSREYVPPANALAARFFVGGAVLLVATGLTRIGFSQLLNLARPPVTGLILTVLVYFLLGAVMLGQIRYTALQERWREQGVPVAGGLAARWVRYSLAFFGLAALIAFVLPTGYTVGLLDLVRLAVSVVVTVLWFIGVLLLLPLLWLLSLLIPGMTVSTPSLGNVTPPVPPPNNPAGSSSFAALPKTLLFWAVVIALLVYVVRGYLRDHPEVAQALARFQPFRLLGRLWAALWRGLRGQAAALRSGVAQGLARLRPRQAAPGQPFRLVRPGALAPREQVLYYYLSIVRRASRHGFRRQPGQTPAEYRATLTPGVPQASDDFAKLTDAFVAARYSPHPIAPDDADRARTAWQRVKAALQARRRERRGE